MSPDEPVQPELREQERSTRRAFLGGAGRKAAYVAPVVLTLAAQQACASGPACGSNFKHTIGSPCATDASAKDCCPTDLNGTTIECHTHMDAVTMTCEEPGSPL